MKLPMPLSPPQVARIESPKALQVGPWVGGRPIGATLHHTADADLERVIRESLKRKIGYHLLIARDGTIVQTAFLDGRVNHAGPAQWNGFSPNRAHLAIALVSWGRLKNPARGVYYSWSGAKVSPYEVDHRPGLDGKTAPWHVATIPQERALAELVAWCVIHLKIDPRHLCGHDECALPAGRKDDPGGVLGKPVSSLRQALAGAVAAS